MGRQWQSLGSLLLLAAVAACGGDRGWSGTTADSAGVAMVDNPTTGLWTADEVPAVTEELRIGTADGDPEYQFAQIAGLQVDADGRIYVMDQQARKVRIYDAEGKHIASFGKAGSGPGELSQGAGPVLLGPGDTLLVPDVGLQRVDLFTVAGEPAGSFPVDIKDGLPMKWAVTADHHLVEQARRMPFPGQAAFEPQEHILVRGMDGAVLDTVLQLPAGQTFSLGGGAPQIRLFYPEPVWDLAEDGRLLSAMNNAYRIEVRDPDGKLARVIRKPFEKQPVTESDRQAFMKLFRETLQRQGLPPAAFQQVERMVQFADDYPAFATILAGPERTIWVQRVKTASSVQEGEQFDARDTGSDEWEVFSPDGRYMGVITLPKRFTPITVKADRIYGVWRDDLDVQHVVRLRVGGLTAAADS